MKKNTILCLFLSSLSARADLTITQSIEGHGKPSTVIMKIKGDKMRMDIGPMSMIMDTTSGDSITIMNPNKSYMMMSGSQRMAMVEQVKKMTGQEAAAPAVKPALVDTGKSEQVNGHNAEIYTADLPAGKATLWITKDFPNYADVTAQLQKIQDSPAGKLSASTLHTPADLYSEGLAIKIQYARAGQPVTVTILSADEKPIDDADMVITPPAGYTTITMPNLGGAGAAAPKP